jgi:hypothetical protein
MSVQEILGTPVTKWKWKECQEIIDSSEATPEQKVTAQERKDSIKKWLDSKNGTSTPNVQSNYKANTPVTGHKSSIDTTKIELHASEMEAIRKAVHEKNQIILVKLEQIRKDLALHNIHNPALEGLLLKIHENVE